MEYHGGSSTRRPFELCMCSRFSKFVFALVSIKEAEEFESHAKCSLFFYLDACVCSVFFAGVSQFFL